jgi:hypothetical protein
LRQPSTSQRQLCSIYFQAFSLLFVMFERCVQTANDFRSRFEERLRFRLGYLINVAAQMID